MNTNHRIALTKELVHRALIRLLKTRQLHKISIRELCEVAGINRTTFYNHYGSQYDVLAEIRDWYLRDIARTLEHTDMRDQKSVLERVTLVFTYMEENLEVSRLLIQNNIDETFAQRLFSLPKIEEMLAEVLPGALSEEACRDIVSFAIYGSYKLVIDWIGAEDRRSPEALAAGILRLADAVCKMPDQGSAESTG